MAGGGSGLGKVQNGPYHSLRGGGRAKSRQVAPGEEVRVRVPKRGKQARPEPAPEGKEPVKVRDISGRMGWVVLLCYRIRGSRPGRAQGRSQVYLTRAIGSNDGGEPLKRSDNLPTLVRLKVLDLNQFQETHDGDGAGGCTKGRAVRPGTGVARAGNTAVQAGRTTNLARISPGLTGFPASGESGTRGVSWKFVEPLPVRELKTGVWVPPPFLVAWQRKPLTLRTEP